LGPVRAYGMPFWRASTQTRQAQPGRGIVTAPPEPRISTLKCSDADRVPDGLQLEERRDLVEALRVGRAEDDALHVLGRRALEVGAEAVGAGEVDCLYVHLTRTPARLPATLTRQH